MTPPESPQGPHLARRWSGLYLFAWKAATRLSKEWIRLQDRTGGYSYSRWLRSADRDFWQREEPAAEMTAGARVGVLLGANPEPGASTRLEDTIRSLQAQSFAGWEAWIDLRSSAGDLPPALIQIIDADPRIHCPPVWCIPPALESGPADWYLLLGWGDVLPTGFLARSLIEIYRNPETDVLYWDEDQVEDRPGGGSSHPWLKPDWSPEMLVSANHLRHALVRRDLLAGAAAAGTRGLAGIDDLVFRLAEKASCVSHAAHVGVHCGCGADPTHETRWNETRLAAVTAHLQRLGIEGAQASPGLRGQVRVRWPAGKGRVSIIIPTRDKLPYLKRCLASILEKTCYPDFEIVLADTGSQEPETLAYYESLAAEPRIRILYDREPFNYSRVNNWAARQAGGDFFVFLNNDTEVEAADWLDELARWGRRPEIGIVGAKLLYPDGKIQHAGIVVGMEGHASHVFSGLPDGATGPFGSLDWYRDVSAVTGACLSARREVFEKIGGFDERFVIAFGDVEICQRAIRHGYRVLYNPYARLIHYEGKTRANLIPAEDIQAGFEALKDAVKTGDPYYNPNLSSTVRVPTLRRGWEEDPFERLQKILAASR
jgi:GT2 family glycosyltransferase